MDNQFMESEDLNKVQESNFNKNQTLDIALTPEQYTYIQYHLPKGFALIQKKSNKRPKKDSSIKTIENENFSRLSATQQGELKFKRQRSKMKKVDKYLESEIPLKVQKRPTIDKQIQLNDEMSKCLKILNQIKKHKYSFPFLQPVDPQQSGAVNYFDVITQPMDLSMVDNKLKRGDYKKSTEFYEDINKIWRNSYTYNEKNSKLYKITIEMEKYCKNLKQLESKSKTNSDTLVTLSQEKYKSNLFQRFKALPSNAIAEIVSMLNNEDSNAKTMNFDIDELDQKGLDEMEQYVKSYELKYNIKTNQL